MAATRNSDNVRVFGSLNDAIWVAPLGTTLPEVLELDLPAPWVPLGWLGQNGIPMRLAVEVEKFRGHQGGALIRSKATSTERGFSFVALEDTPAVNKIYHDASDPVETSAGSGVARMDLPESVGVVSLACVVQLQDEGVTKFYCLERIDIGEREEVAHSGTEMSGYGMSCDIIGDAYLLTDAAAFTEAFATP